MTNVIHTDLFDALFTMDHIIIQRDKAWSRYIHYQLNNTVAASNWMHEWIRCNEALVKIKRDFPVLEGIYEGRDRKEKVERRRGD